MRQYLPIIIILLGSCSAPDSPKQNSNPNVEVFGLPIKERPDTVYANKRFRDVEVDKKNDTTYRVTGLGQIFEASFNWVVEDGHEELASGHEMTDAGAPDWGSFKFDISVRKKKENSTLTLILFEISAKDGSRTHELPISLN